MQVLGAILLGMKEDRELSTAIQKIVEEMRPIPAQIGVAVINLKSSEPKIAGVNLDEFIYPASVYKMLVAAEVLRRIDMGDLAPEQRIKVAEINVVDTD